MFDALQTVPRRKVWRVVAAAAVVALAAILISGATSSSQHRHTRTGRPGPVLLQLFTSQGCSSCPPADKLLNAIGSERTDVIPLAYHVDYWNHLGWSDPFSSQEWSDLQRRYAQAAGSAQVYTPQLIVNGTTELVGSASSAVRDAIAREIDDGSRAVVVIEHASLDNGTLHLLVHAEADKDTSDGALVVAVFENGITTKVERGENSGISLKNDYIVRWQSVIGDHLPVRITNKHTMTIPLDPAWSQGRLGVAVFAQNQKTLEIYGSAAKLLR